MLKVVFGQTKFLFLELWWTKWIKV